MLGRITLTLARSPEHPDGDPWQGYEITAPLDATGRLDPAGWALQRELCRVRRFRAGAADRYGWLIHRAGGAGGARWVIDYDDRSEEDDEEGYRLDKHVFEPGEYVSLRDEDGDLQAYKITAVRPVHGGKEKEAGGACTCGGGCCSRA